LYFSSFATARPAAPAPITNVGKPWVLSDAVGLIMHSKNVRQDSLINIFRNNFTPRIANIPLVADETLDQARFLDQRRY